MPLPTGTLTLLFTDIEGSTALVQSLGAERYAALSARRPVRQPDAPDRPG